MTSAQDSDTAPTSPVAAAISGLAMRSIGPAFMGGRIADIAVHPRRRSTWYLAVGSGGVWKTVNSGVTWKPVFDAQSSYSIGCVTIDPNRPDVVWVGTGENVSGRHVAWGDGVYRSLNGGTSWTRMGLEHSEHIAGILVDPRDSDTVYVAAEGPLWSSGGERGVYKTVNGGGTWEQVLGIDDDTGVTSIAFAPDDPDMIYAAAYRRRRRAWSFLGGGESSGIHTSSDGGATWTRITEGLPKGAMGKIGLAVTPAAPDVVYATIEADPDSRGFYRSTDRGQSWERQCEYVSGGTGPHYYQEIFASPTDPERVYQVDVFVHVTRDGGKTFKNLETGRQKHSDNHVVWIDPDDGDHLLVGTDAGLYETFDDGGSFRHFSNLPVSQFYRLAVDNSEPFFNILGGAQDLGTLHGPSRTLHVDGVRNQDWWVPLGADGYHVAFDPEDPDVSYMEWQVGNVLRHDHRTMELQDIQPQAGPDDPPERWNWDTPILISPHDSNRIYLASQRVWRSDDRGDSWTAVSPDLTTNRNRYELPTFERVASVDSLYDHDAMSLYCTITNISESPLVEGLLYVGTDDGQIQVSEDGGATWRAAGLPPGLPADAFVNGVEASLHDEDVAYVVADAHKNGDYSPYVFESHDRGRTWLPLRGDLPDGTTVWVLRQDHVAPDLLFLGTEFGIYVTPDGGGHWHKLSKDVPTIAFRDLALHPRDNDLVGASFGRGFYVLDDYTVLRDLTTEGLAEPASLFPVRDAWWYVPYQPMQAIGQPTLGSTAYRAPNPPFGATFTYHLLEDAKSAKKLRNDLEKEHDSGRSDVPFPGWEALSDEHLENDPAVMLIVRDATGATIRRLAAETKAGLHRTTWDLRHAPPDPIKLEKPEFVDPWDSPPRGPLVVPGIFSVELVRVTPTGDATLSGPEPFVVKPIPATAGASENDTDFQVMTADIARRVAGASKHVEQTEDRVRHLRAALLIAPSGDAALHQRLDDVHRRLGDLRFRLIGDPVREKLAEPGDLSVRNLVDRVSSHHWDTTQLPTATQRTSIDRAGVELESVLAELATLVEDDLARLTADIDTAGGPWTPR